MPLTDTGIRKAKLKETPYKLSDSGGLYLWVTPSGGRLWRWAYRYEGKQKLMTFGRYPDVSLMRPEIATLKVGSFSRTGSIRWHSAKPRRTLIDSRPKTRLRA